MSHDVFISYPNKDKVIADAVCAKLEDDKIRVWIAPRDVPAGMNFAESIIDAIDTCKVFVLIWSASTNASEHILNELNQAFDQGIIVIPFRIENVEPSKALKYYIGRTHWLDAMTPPLEKHIKFLADTILTNLGRQAEIKPEIPVVKEKEVRKEKKIEKEAEIKPASKPSAKLRAWWPYLAGLVGVAVVIGLALTLFKQPAQPTSNPLANVSEAMETSKQPNNTPMATEISNQPTNTPMETATAKPPSTPVQPTETPIQPTESNAGYQTQDLGTPDYQTGFTRAAFDFNEWPERDIEGQRVYWGEDDTYQFELQPPISDSTAFYKDGNKTFANSIVEVEAKFVEGYGGEVGIVCRATRSQSSGGDLEGYMAHFYKNGRISINKIKTFPYGDLVVVDNAIKESGIYYRLRFDCIG
ncbi:MAG: TIR domain-containing protein, partial [Anaerolineaceae bacterium]|nr:TIR domain-containing protein [Anaerolineaceae bacterium]